MNIKNFFTKAEKTAIVQAISDAEEETSGEIRVHMEKHCKGNLMDRTAFIFKKLKMHKTALRNGILIYIALEDHKFSIIGDAGINKQIPEGFWNHVKEVMQKHFTDGDLVPGLCEGIHQIGHQLKTYFPHKQNDKNELSNEISFGS